MHTPETVGPDLARLAGNLSSLLDAGDSHHTGWNASDFAPLLEHQMAASLSGDLSEVFDDAPQALAGMEELTFGALLSSATPALPALEMVRHFAKLLITRPDRLYPDEVARVVYFAAIAAAEMHAGTRITQLEAVKVREGYAWALNQNWLTNDLRALFEKALQA